MWHLTVLATKASLIHWTETANYLGQWHNVEVLLLWSGRISGRRKKKVIMRHNSPSHWPVFWSLLNPDLHWQTALTLVWLQMASSPHGLVFLPHTSPLETNQHQAGEESEEMVAATPAVISFFLMCKTAKRASTRRLFHSGQQHALHLLP